MHALSACRGCPPSLRPVWSIQSKFQDNQGYTEKPCFVLFCFVFKALACHKGAQDCKTCAVRPSEVPCKSIMETLVIGGLCVLTPDSLKEVVNISQI